MKFITEGDLRDLYKKEPFTAYDLESDARLTPGARQFLADRGIYMLNDALGTRTTKTTKAAELPESKNNWKKLRLYSMLKSIDALFLLTVEELLSRDVCLAQSTLKLNRQFSCIKNSVKNNGIVENLTCSECTGINENNFSDTLEDCFEITDFHMQLEKGREILILHRLRSALQEVEPVLQELSCSSEEEKKLFEGIVCKVNQVINSLSQLICSAVGGEKCQRKG
ncbi:cobalamin adenosyltransferase [Neobacillus sp. WH10]|uniref:cobalamin adenosyltransferase n=1 Tax=Neobacillus sp. WH10 TaxID=3047873 RepID=UPI0024C1A2DA|nr:cobalamin adenosyltransferase [Neobacillus sp. WH10]WHY79523.1 cobalamin adenosyltransferase [Neobacillus sp. WH10]